MKREQSKFKSLAVLLVALFLTAGLTTPATAQKTIEPSDEQVENRPSFLPVCGAVHREQLIYAGYHLADEHRLHEE